MRAGLSQPKESPDGEGPKALAFFHALILAGVVLAPLSASLDLKRPLIFLWAAFGLIWIAVDPASHTAPRRAFAVSLLAFLAAWLLAGAFSSYPQAAPFRLENQFLFSACAIVAASLPAGRRRWTIMAWSLSTACLTSIVLLQVFERWQSDAVGLGRMQGSFGNPLFLGAFALTSALLGSVWLGTGWKGSLTWGFCWAIAYFAGGRAAWLMVLAQIFFVFLVWKGWAGGVAERRTDRWEFLVKWAGFPAFATFLLDWARPTDRMAVWLDSYELWLRSPLVGHGPGSFPLAFQTVTSSGLSERLASSGQFAEHPHNWIASLAAEGGALVLAAFIAVLIVATRFAWTSLATEDREGSRLKIAALAGCGAFLVENLFDRGLEVPGLSCFFWILLGWAAVPVAKESKKLSLEFGGTAIIALLGVSLLVLGARPLVTNHEKHSLSRAMEPKAVEDEAGLRTHLVSRPKDPLAWEALGSHLAFQQRYAEAAPAFERALALDPRSRAAAINLGNSRFMLSDFRAAEAAFRRALALDPGYAESHFNLGACLFYQRRLKEAVAELDAALKLDPGHARARKLKAQILQ